MFNLHKKASSPFRFYTGLYLRELTDFRARNLIEFVEHLKRLPEESIFQHTHMFLHYRGQVPSRYTNDFSCWIGEVMGERELGEELAGIDIFEFNSINALRERIISILEENLFERTETIRMVSYEKAFQFVNCRGFIFPMPYEARNLSEFIRILGKVTVNSVFFHFYEARFRLEKGVNDFSCWIETSLGDEALAKKVAAASQGVSTLEDLRARIIEIIRTGGSGKCKVYK